MDEDRITACLTSTKTFSNYPCAHRQWRHDGDCKLIHGYSRSFHFVFGAKVLDKCGFTVDFGKLKKIKQVLDDHFDHTLLLNADDPEFSLFRELEERGVCRLRTIPYGIGMEGTAQWLCEVSDKILRTETKGRCWVVSVEARENDKNSAIFVNPEAGFRGWIK